MQVQEAIAMDAYNGEGNDADAVLAGADQLMQRGQQDDDVVHERHGYGQGFADFDFQGDGDEPWAADANDYGGGYGRISPG